MCGVCGCYQSGTVHGSYIELHRFTWGYSSVKMSVWVGFVVGSSLTLKGFILNSNFLSINTLGIFHKDLLNEFLEALRISDIFYK